MIKKIRILFFSLISISSAILIFGCKSNPQDNTSLKSIEVLKTYASYNAWANDEFINWLKEKDTLCLTDSIPSSFSTIKNNLTHLWGAEIGWLQTLRGEDWDVPKNLSKNKSISETLEGFSKTTNELKNYIKKLKPEDFINKKQLSKGEVSADHILIHILNHASYHRGQIVTIARNLKITDPPRTDFIYYVSSVK